MNSAGMVYSLDLGGHEVRYSFLDPGTHEIFGRFIEMCSDDHFDIRLTRDYMEDCRWLVTLDTSDDYLEFQSLMLATGNQLLEVNRALFHGVSFVWKDKAWIITGPSGVGKTTQYRNWRKLLRHEIKIINGDKPVITCRDDGTVLVSSSPWRGKERLGHPGMCAELGGIILLEQGDHNKISRMTAQEAVHPLFIEFVSYPENAEQVRCQGRILDQMLGFAPVWKLINTGDMDSAVLTRDTLLQYLEAAHE